MKANNGATQGLSYYKHDTLIRRVNRLQNLILKLYLVRVDMDKKTTITDRLVIGFAVFPGMANLFGTPSCALNSAQKHSERANTSGPEGSRI